MSPEPIILRTSDGVTLKGAFYAADQPRGQALLLHMMPAAKESWSAFASALAARGVSALAIDMRGHGASDGGPDGYRAFPDAGHQAKRLDVDAALAWLRDNGGRRIAVAGASIGANLAMRAAAENEDISACLALSPGSEYRGVSAAEAVGRLRSGQKLMLAVSEEDAYSAESVDAMGKLPSKARVDVRRLSDAGHGTAMFEGDPAFFEDAVAWLTSSL